MSVSQATGKTIEVLSEVLGARNRQSWKPQVGLISAFCHVLSVSLLLTNASSEYTVHVVPSEGSIPPKDIHK